MAKGVYDGPIYVDVSFQSKIYCGWLQMKIEMYAVIKSSRNLDNVRRRLKLAIKNCFQIFS